MWTSVQCGGAAGAVGVWKGWWTNEGCRRGCSPPSTELVDRAEEHLWRWWMRRRDHPHARADRGMLSRQSGLAHAHSRRPYDASSTGSASNSWGSASASLPWRATYPQYPRPYDYLLRFLFLSTLISDMRREGDVATAFHTCHQKTMWTTHRRKRPGQDHAPARDTIRRYVLWEGDTRSPLLGWVGERKGAMRCARGMMQHDHLAMAHEWCL
jgi:hypothetical protein